MAPVDGGRALSAPTPGRESGAREALSGRRAFLGLAGAAVGGLLVAPGEP